MPAKLTPREQNVYDIVVENGEISPTELAPLMGRKLANAGKYLRRLERKGWLVKRLATDVDDQHTTWTLYRAKHA